MIYILSVLVFLFYFQIYLVLTKPKRDLQKRLEVYTKDEQDIRKLDPTKASERNLRVSLRDLGKVILRINRLQGIRERLDSELIKSGILLRGEEFLGLMVVNGALFSILSITLTQSTIVSAVAGLLGLWIPILVLRIKKKKRQEQFNEQLGEVLTTMANALRSGHSLLKAFEVVAKDSSSPAGDEFAYVVKEMQLGISTEEALSNLQERNESDDLELMVTAILIQRQVGGNLAEVLDSISETIRDRLRIQGEIKSLTAQGRLSGVIISILPVALGLFFYVVNPEYILELFRDPLGIFMLVMAAVSQAVGTFLIKRVVDIEV